MDVTYDEKDIVSGTRLWDDSGNEYLVGYYVNIQEDKPNNYTLVHLSDGLTEFFPNKKELAERISDWLLPVKPIRK